MTLLNMLQRRRTTAITVFVVTAGVALVGIWRSGNSQVTSAAGVKTEKQKFHERLRNGIGREVRFSTAKDSEENIRASIESVASFIHRRANMTMSEETKKDLLKAEADTLSGKAPRISLGALTDSMTASAAERIGTLSEKEIQGVANTFRPTSPGQIALRMAGQEG